MKDLYDTCSAIVSKRLTLFYTTSFAIGIRLLAPHLRQGIYDIYGLVRIADEIVDSFHDYNKAQLLDDFEQSTYTAMKEGISTNPIIHRFQYTAHKYRIEKPLVESFFKSMRMDIYTHIHDKESFTAYVYGSSEVIGLMCLRVFTQNDTQTYETLKAPTQTMGAVLQKINFLRDLHIDYQDLARHYFPGVDMTHFTMEDKVTIEKNIEQDFLSIRKKILLLAPTFRYSIYIIYRYYFALFKKIQKTPIETLLEKRVRIHDLRKTIIFAKVSIRKLFRA